MKRPSWRWASRGAAAIAVGMCAWRSQRARRCRGRISRRAGRCVSRFPSARTLPRHLKKQRKKMRDATRAAKMGVAARKRFVCLCVLELFY